jgi:hypothetical protein
MRALVVSVSDCPNDVPFVVPRLPVASFMLPARPKGQRFSSVWVEDDVDYEDRGFDSPRQEVRYSGRDVANSVLFPPAQAGPSWRDRGAFVAAGDKPTEEELKAAEAARDTYRRKLIDDARFSFQKNRHSRNIGDEAFWAAERMGLEEDWLPLAANPCPSCGVAIKSDAAVCRHCGVILDHDKHAAFTYVSTATPGPAPARASHGTR